MDGVQIFALAIVVGIVAYALLLIIIEMKNE